MESLSPDGNKWSISGGSSNSYRKLQSNKVNTQGGEMKGSIGQHDNAVLTITKVVEEEEDLEEGEVGGSNPRGLSHSNKNPSFTDLDPPGKRDGFIIDLGDKEEPSSWKAHLQSGNREREVSSQETNSKEGWPGYIEMAEQGGGEGSIKKGVNNKMNTQINKNQVSTNPSGIGEESVVEMKPITARTTMIRRVVSRKPTFVKEKSRFVDQEVAESPSNTKILSPLATPPVGGGDRNPSAAVRTFRDNAQGAEGEDDPFKDADLPDKYRRRRCGPLQIFEWCLFLFLVTGLVLTLTIEAAKRKSLWQLELWKWAVLVLVIFSGRLVSGWLVHISVILLERSFIMRKHVLYFVYGLRNGVQNCIWLSLALISWRLLFNSRVERSPKSRKALWIITNLFICLLIASFLWLLKILLVKVLASSFQKNAYFDRIQESLFGQYVLKTLLGPPLVELEMMARLEEELLFSKSNPSKSSSSNLKGNNTASLRAKVELHKGDPKNLSAWKLKKMMKLVRNPHITTIVDIIDESIGKGKDSKELEIRSEKEAKVAAKRIFKNVAKPNAKIIEEDDLLRFMHDDEVAKVLSFFGDGKDTVVISKYSLKNWVVKIFQERRALAYSLNDTNTSVDDLHQLAGALVAVLIVLISLMIFGIATQKMLLFISSQLLLVVFIFGNTCKQIFESIIFLFVMHPYDVGDRCIIDGSQLVVEEMNILTTVFLRPSNEKIYYPNNVLASKPISNLYRSPDMFEDYDFSIHISTSFNKITELKGKVSSFIESNPGKWHPKVTLVLKDIEEVNRLRMTLRVQDTMNFQDAAERWARRSTLLFQVKSFFEELGIDYRLLPQEVQLTQAASLLHRL